LGGSDMSTRLFWFGIAILTALFWWGAYLLFA
jgi:hypothetical protein